jgi:elongation factor P hydroxylase
LDIDLAKACGKRDRSPKFYSGHYRERNVDHGKWYNPNGSDDGVQRSKLLGFWILSIVRKSKYWYIFIIPVFRILEV